MEKGGESGLASGLGGQGSRRPAGGLVGWPASRAKCGEFFAWARRPAAAGSRKFFKIFAFGCESFVFVYMGLAMFTVRTAPGH